MINRQKNPLPTICAAPFAQNKFGRPAALDGSEEQRQLWVGVFAEDEDVNAWIEKVVEIQAAVNGLNNQLDQAQALYGQPGLRPAAQLGEFQAVMAALVQDGLFPTYESLVITDRTACQRLFDAAQLGLALCKNMSTALGKYDALSQLDPGSPIRGTSTAEKSTNWPLVAAVGGVGVLAYFWLRGSRRGASESTALMPYAGGPRVDQLSR